MNRRSFALLGAGEFEDWHAPIDRELLAGTNGDGRVLIAPVASAPEGDDVFASWAAKGLDHYGRLGVPAQVLPLKTREDAARPEVIESLDEASMIFFSGGNPWYLAKTLEGTLLWSRLQERIDDGLAYAGCSAGVACLTERTYDSDTDDFEQIFQRGLAYTRRILFAPHWDMLDTWVPGAREAIVASLGPGETLVGLDERTAIVGDGASWEIRGLGAVHLIADGDARTATDGDAFVLAICDDAAVEGREG